MPTYTIAPRSLEKTGAVLPVRVSVSAPLEATLRRAGDTVPAPVTARALVDPGSPISAIRPAIAAQLGLQTVGTFFGHSATTRDERLQVYVVRLLLPEGGVLEGQVAAAALLGGAHECLIGRNLLKGAVFVYIGSENLCTLSI